jgi:hypothetical protein
MRSYIRWQRAQGNRRTASPHERRVPRSRSPLTPHAEVILLAQLAAEVEHALLVQYMYALYSLGFPDTWPAEHVAEMTVWAKHIYGIALQEMGHLATVQNLLWSLGGPLHFDREQLPHPSPFYPFPFELEPLGKDSLAKYIAAEMPPWSSIDPGLKRKVRPILRRAVAGTHGRPINRVGALYAQLSLQIRGLDEATDFYFDSARRFQAVAAEWGAVDQTSADPLGGALLVCPLASKSDALTAIDLVARQGEGLQSAELDRSHFLRFLEVFDTFPETNPRYGPVAWVPTREVPSHPCTLPSLTGDAALERGRITDPVSLRLGHLLNLRYRNLLQLLEHYFLVDRTADGATKTLLGGWARDEMKGAVRTVALTMTHRPRKLPTEYSGGRELMAGAPFEMPFSISLPEFRWGRWKSHLDLLDASTSLIQRILADTSLPSFVRRVVTNIAADDKRRRPKILDHLNHPGGS